MNPPSNALHLVEGAVRLLAIGEHQIKHRLLSAYTQKLQYVKAAELPAEVAPMLASIFKRLRHSKATETPSIVESALGLMEVSIAVKLAADIFELNAVLSHALYH